VLKTFLREQSVIIHALLDGLQTILIRKGSAEEERRFLLYPRYGREHQESKGFQSRYHDYLASHVEPRGEKVKIEGWASIEGLIRVDDPWTLTKVQEYYLWSPSNFAPPYVWERYEFSPTEERFFNIALLRVHKLTKPKLVEPIPEPKYECACHAPYLQLKEDISLDDSVRVISDEAFSRVSEGIEKITGQPTLKLYA
jgi:hypothetical protein